VHVNVYSDLLRIARGKPAEPTGYCSAVELYFVRDKSAGVFLEYEQTREGSYGVLLTKRAYDIYFAGVNIPEQCRLLNPEVLEFVYGKSSGESL